MEIIIAIVIVVAFVAVWYNRRSPAAPVVEAETFSDNGIKFTAKEEAPAPVVAPAAPAPVVAETTPAKKPRAKKPAVVAKTATNAKKASSAKKAPAKKPAKTAKAK